MKKLKIGANITERIIMIIDDQNNYSSKILKKIDATYAHGTKIFQILDYNKIIKKVYIGRKMYIRLTEKGMKIQHHLNEIKELLQ